MEAIPSYVMQRAALPMHICEKIDKVNRDFYGGPLRIKGNSILWAGGKLLNQRMKEA